MAWLKWGLPTSSSDCPSRFGSMRAAGIGHKCQLRAAITPVVESQQSASPRGSGGCSNGMVAHQFTSAVQRFAQQVREPMLTIDA